MSVADKRGVAEFVAELDALGIEVISTGGTARLLRNRGIRVAEAADFTGFPEILGGRFKTLHPFLHCAILALRDRPDHLEALARHGIQPIDLVVVNLGPFEEVAARADCTVEEAIETIDIGGAALLRSAAKNHHFVAALCDPDDYEPALRELRATGELSPSLRAELALKAFRLTARYDRAVANYLASNIEGRFPSLLALDFRRVQELRHGENPHQAAAFYRLAHAPGPCLGAADLLAGAKALSATNLLDLEVAFELVKDLEGPAAAIAAHANPCGAAVAADVGEAFARAYATSPSAAFGAVVALNRPLDSESARRIAAPAAAGPPELFEAIIAPDYHEEALEVLVGNRTWGSSLRVLRAGPLGHGPRERAPYRFHQVGGGLVVEDEDGGVLGEPLAAPTRTKPTGAQLRDLALAAACAKHARSNALVLARDQRTVGIGAGQPTHLDAALLALRRAGKRARGAVAACDGALAFADTLEALARAGCTAIVQPGGSRHDDAMVAKADALGLAMALSGVRHFRH